MMIWMVVIAPALMTAWLIFQYLRSLSLLVETLERWDPQLWESLGRPRWVSWQEGAKTMCSVSPPFPFALWLLKGKPGNADADTKVLYWRTRKLLIGGLCSVVVTLSLMSFAMA